MIIESLDPERNFDSAKAAGKSTGKSGSFFFFSHNKQFIIKTIFEEELKMLICNNQKYFKHL